MAIGNVYGSCPVCGMCDGYLNVGDEQWFYCADHAKKWLFGLGSFSARHDRTEGGVRAEEFLRDFEAVSLRMQRP